ncbi:hypothetical protein A9P82_13275 [Arachidicoccus ginsenosidimutans]|uniref:hypothetical protein n=1 Tax=Arachidicoccus sp. BS20 TaxID=1850526 RepID=UPI0007F14247|nr:hypothetical protein [Arachidicoccus sp. BS20]ANI90171.1 hypothetical protein A9P82_13275 [Arachidicoccus sp. BS20]
MRKIFLLLVCLTVFGKNYAQDSVLLRGPYQPNSKYKQKLDRKLEMSVSLDVDSATLKKMEANGISNPIVQNHSFKSDAIITTGNIMKNDSFPLIAEMSLIGNNLPQNLKMILYAQVHPGESPHLDSLDLLPKMSETDSAKASLFPLLKNIFNNVQYPTTIFHVGDSTKNTTDFPMNMPGVQLTMHSVNTYRLLKIENGIAYFSINYNITMNMVGNTNTIMNGKGGGNGTGYFSYDIANGYYKQTGNNIDMNVSVKFYNPDTNEGLKMEIWENEHSQDSIEKID